MALKVYVGINGSGKSYEVTTNPILGALRAGRRVVSNIAGLNYPAMVEVLKAEGLDETLIGQLVTVTHEQVLDPLFWRTDKDAQEGTKTIIQPGDLVALDEIWRFWQGFGTKDVDGNKRPTQVLNFFRMHRHMTNEITGFTCEIVLITQDIGDIHRSVKSVIEQTFVMTKHTALGMDTRYVVQIFQQYNTRKKPIRTLQRQYDPEMFKLYTSHSQTGAGAAAVEESVDKRGNILLGSRFSLVLPILFLLACCALYYLSDFFHPKKKEKPVENTSVTAAASPAEVDQAAPVLPAPEVKPTTTWRVVGIYSKSGTLTVVAQDKDGTVRYIVNPPGVRTVGLDIGVLLPDESFTNWSGPSTIKQAGSS